MKNITAGKMTDIMKGAEPFLLKGGAQGVLLVHGFTGSPPEMRMLGNFLQEKGFTVLGVRLAGHGSSVANMEHCLWEDWYHSVLDGYYLLKDICEDVAVAGLSMGGILALLLAAEIGAVDVISMSAPIYITTKGIELLPPKEKCWGKFFPKRRRAFSDEAAYFSLPYNHLPLAAVHELIAAIAAAKDAIAKITGRLLVVQSMADHTVRPDSADFIYDNATSCKEREKFILAESGHLVTLDKEREKVFAAVLKFLAAGHNKNE
jgi:carboxylesterase